MTVREPEFDQFADSYDADHAASVALSGEEPAFFSEYKIRRMRRYVDRMDLPHARILDFGAGIGNALGSMRTHFPDAAIDCIDVSGKSLEQLERRHPGMATTHVFDGRHIPFADDSFDLIFTACVFHHIDADQHVALLAEIRRVLKPGGRFALFEHNPWNPLTQHAVRICPFDADAVLISAPEMRRRFRAAGFKAPALDFTLFFPRPLAFFRPLENWLTWLPIGAQYCLHAGKYSAQR